MLLHEKTAAAPVIDQSACDEIDEDMMEVFRWEAEELLSSIAVNLIRLGSSPDDKNALWEIRRSAHTFKGAAGMVGLMQASKLAHELEDALDRVVESGAALNSELLGFIERSSSRLASMVAQPAGSGSTLVQDEQKSNETVTAKAPPPAAEAISTRTVKAPTPVLRISLTRLEELTKASKDLIAAIGRLAHPTSDREAFIHNCFHQGKNLSEKLGGLRLLRFGNLQGRLGSVINATSIEENKKAQFVLHTPEVEIDTQIIDVLVEPIMHLLKNAVVHGIESPETRQQLGKSEIGLVSIAVSVDAGEISIMVSDDGAGLSPDKLKRRAVDNGMLTAEDAAALSDAQALQLIFNEGLSTADKLSLSAGRGIGMNIVKRAVEEHAGRVDLSSRAGHGTTFTIRIPATFVPSAKPARENSVEVKDMGDGPYVLVVDDSATVRRRNADIVEGAGYKVVTADNGEDALSILNSASLMPSLIISDVEMPIMTGYGLLKTVKQDKRFRDIPFVLVTSLDTTTSRQTAAQLGASGYAIKPLTSDAFARVLATVTIVA
jgi:chemotaxis protein histidine kinase CheA/CheY-like chemotaxis protein